jgi:N-acetylglucosamine-6-phosphate deacetylase
MTRGPTLVVRAARTVRGETVDIACRDGRFVASPPPGEAVATLDAEGLTAVPGFLDLHVNGAGGIDLTDEPARVWDVAAELPRFGVTRFLPTLVSPHPAAIRALLTTLDAGPPAAWHGALPLGAHLEGPFLAPGRAGAHDPAALRAPSLAAIDGWSRDRGVAMVTLAPELPGALDVVATLTARGVVVALGHTDADDATVRRATAAGARAVTHLFNAMGPLHHRAPGLAGAVLGGAPLVATLVADGAHLHPDALRLAWAALGPDRRILVSDATAALGVVAGAYRLAGRVVTSDGRAVRDASGGLAGACRGLDHAVRTVVEATGCGLGDAAAAVTDTPARLVGRADLGSLRPGAAADLALLDRDLRVVATVVAGRVRHGGGDR